MSMSTPPLGATPPGPASTGPASEPFPTETPGTATQPGALSSRVPAPAALPVSSGPEGGPGGVAVLPPLPEPELQFADGEDLALLLDALGQRIRDAHARMSAQGLEHTRRQSGSVGQGVINRLGEAAARLTEALGKAKANEVWTWLAQSSSFTGALAAQAASLQPTVDENGQLTGPPLLALAVLGALSASTDLAGMGSIDDLLPADMRHSGRLEAPDGRLLSLGFGLAEADTSGALAEQQALLAEATPEAAARLRLAVSIGVAVTTLTTLLSLTLQRLGQDAEGLDLSWPGDLTADQADTALHAQMERAQALMGRVATAVERSSGEAADAQQAATQATRKAHHTAQQAQLAVREIVRRQLQMQQQSAQMQITGPAAAQVSALGVSQDLAQTDAERAAAREMEQRLTELAMQQEDQRETLREMALALQEAMAAVMQQLNASGAPDPRLAAVRQRMAV